MIYCEGFGSVRGLFEGRAPQIPVGCLKIVRECATHGKADKTDPVQEFGGGNLKQTDRLGDLVVIGRIILEWITIINRRCVKIV